MASHNGQPAKILMVDDTPADISLFKEALSLARMQNPVYAVSDGFQALAFLRREPPYENAPRPDLVLLDLNMPRKSGFEVLDEIRRDARLALTPVMVMSSSRQENDIQKSRHLRANAYIVKPVDLDEYIRVVHSIDDFCQASAKISKK